MNFALFFLVFRFIVISLLKHLTTTFKSLWLRFLVVYKLCSSASPALLELLSAYNMTPLQCNIYCNFTDYCNNKTEDLYSSFTPRSANICSFGMYYKQMRSLGPEWIPLSNPCQS